MRRANLTNSMTKGVLDETLSDRIDLVHYYQGLRVGRNSTPRPQGGQRRRQGTMLASGMDLIASGLKRRTRRRLEPLNVTAGMVTVVHGGTAAKLVSQSLAIGEVFVSDAVSGTPFVLAEIDLGVATSVCAIDVERFYCATDGADDALAVEYWNGTSWVQIDARRNIRAMGGNQLTAVDLASTKDIEVLSGLMEVDGVLVTAGQRVLVKNKVDKRFNGVWITNNSGWSRATDANTGDKLENCLVYVTGGSQAGTWWHQPETKITLNVSPIEFYFVPGPERTRRFTVPPGGLAGVPLSARQFRIVLYDAAACGACTIGRVRFWREKGVRSPVAFIPFGLSVDTRFEIVLSDRTLDIFRDHRWISAVTVPVDQSQVTHVTHAVSGDGFVLYHGDVATTVIVRQGGDDEWDASPAPFANMPALSAAVATSSANEQQRLSLAGIAAAQTFVLWVDDEVTAPITFSNTATLASSIASALATLPAFDGDSPAVTLVDAATRTVDIHFTGDLGGRRWASVLATVIGSDVLSPSTKVTRRGVEADGLIASARNGWPRCGVFVQNRHVLGGFRSAPQASMPSRAETAFDFQREGTPLTADLAYIDQLASDQGETILRLTVGRHLLALTESGVWFQEARTYDALQPRNWRLAARPGIEAGVPVVHLDDAPLYMQAGEQRPGGVAASRVMRELNLVTSVDATYVANVKNVLSPKLVTAAVDFFGAETRSGDEPARGWVINADGTIAHLATLRDQEVVGFLPWDTDGKFITGGADIAGNVWIIVEREADNYLERLDETTPLDGTIAYSFSVPTSTLGGLGEFAGKSLVVYANGDCLGPHTVSGGGTITLASPATTAFAGRAVEWELESMPFREKLTEQQPFSVPARIYELEFTVRNAGPFELSINGGPYQPVPINFFGAAMHDPSPFQKGGNMELPLLERLYTGPIVLTDLQGWSKYPRWNVRQALPAPIEITAVRLGVSYKGG
jgi:hypothetical protein